MVIERITRPRFRYEIPPESKSPTIYVTFELPPAYEGAPSATLTIKESKESALMQFLVDAQKEGKPVYLSKMEKTYDPNPQDKTKHSMALIRSLTLGSKNRLDEMLKKRTPWTIFSPDLASQSNHGYEKDNPAFYLITKRQAASERRKQKALLTKNSHTQIESPSLEERKREHDEAEIKFSATVLKSFATDPRWLDRSLGRLFRKSFPNGSNPMLNQSRAALNKYFMDTFRRKLKIWWNVEDPKSVSLLEQQAIEHCKRLREKGFTAEKLLNEAFAHFYIPTTSSPEPESPKV